MKKIIFFIISLIIFIGCGNSSNSHGTTSDKNNTLSNILMPPSPPKDN